MDGLLSCGHTVKLFTQNHPLTPHRDGGTCEDPISAQHIEVLRQRVALLNLCELVDGQAASRQEVWLRGSWKAWHMMRTQVVQKQHGKRRAAQAQAWLLNVACSVQHELVNNSQHMAVAHSSFNVALVYMPGIT